MGRRGANDQMPRETEFDDDSFDNPLVSAAVRLYVHVHHREFTRCTRTAWALGRLATAPPAAARTMRSTLTRAR
jgi:hypothetical protein